MTDWPMPNLDWGVNLLNITFYFRFNPDRFLNTKMPGYSFRPFGFAGNRQCPASQFAYLPLMIATTTILPRFRFRLVDDTPIKGQMGFVTRPERDIMVTVEHRKWWRHWSILHCE